MLLNKTGVTWLSSALPLSAARHLLWHVGTVAIWAQHWIQFGTVASAVEVTAPDIFTLFPLPLSTKSAVFSLLFRIVPKALFCFPWTTMSLFLCKWCSWDYLPSLFAGDIHTCLQRWVDRKVVQKHIKEEGEKTSTVASGQLCFY